jgi:hypothetical protein
VIAALTVVVAFVGVNNTLNVPEDIDASNDPRDDPVFTSPYCDKCTVVPSCIKLNSIM